MNNSTFSAVMRRAGCAVSRRGSFRLLGRAGLAGAVAAASHAAGKAGKNRKKGATRCRQLGEQCRRGVVEICQGRLDPVACQEFHAPCCEHFARCRVSAGVVCAIFKD
jgi:hypothetical protein